MPVYEALLATVLITRRSLKHSRQLKTGWLTAQDFARPGFANASLEYPFAGGHLVIELRAQ
jgi:hypothetical protein